MISQIPSLYYQNPTFNRLLEIDYIWRARITVESNQELASDQYAVDATDDGSVI